MDFLRGRCAATPFAIFALGIPKKLAAESDKASLTHQQRQRVFDTPPQAYLTNTPDARRLTRSLHALLASQAHNYTGRRTEHP